MTGFIRPNTLDDFWPAKTSTSINTPAAIKYKMNIHSSHTTPAKRRLSPLRMLCAGTLIAAAAFVAAMPAIPAAAPQTKNVSANKHIMHPALRLGPQESLADVQASDAGPQYGLFVCQLAGQSSACYDPYQMRHAYGIDSLIAAGFDGTGHTIVIVDAYQNPTLATQVAHYNAFYGLPATNLTVVAPDGLTPFVVGDPNMTGWAEEISLDVEWAHNMAPGANIVLVSAKSNNDSDILSAVKYAVDHNLGDVISMSFGENESCTDAATTAAYHDVFAAATQKNITLFASAGDQGASQPACDGTTWTLAASSPANDPLVSGVGGTELHAAGFCLPSRGCNPATHETAGTYDSEIV
ncbi:MAG TPA: S8 family serine peptidase, partial [Chthoniobacterales bacterium]